MNATLELLAARRSVSLRSLSEPGPSASELQTLLTIASRVPDHARLAPWRFIVIEKAGAEQLGQFISDVWASDHPDADAERLATERVKLLRAPLVVAVVMNHKEHAKVPDVEQTLSAGAVCMNFTIAANAMGYSTNWVTEWHAFDRRVLTAMGLAAHEQLAGFIYIGTATEKPSERERPALECIVTYLNGVVKE